MVNKYLFKRILTYRCLNKIGQNRNNSVLLLLLFFFMTKQEIGKLPEDEQEFIYSYGLENESYETIQWCERNYNYLVYIGML